MHVDFLTGWVRIQFEKKHDSWLADYIAVNLIECCYYAICVTDETPLQVICGSGSSH